MIKKNILITGAGGYIGSSLVEVLKNKHNLFLLSRNKLPREKNITNIHADISKKNVWKDVLKNIDVVYHLAGQTSAYYANSHPLEDLKTNLFPVVHLIDTCQKYHLSPDIVFAGTVTETGFTDKKTIHGNNEDHPVTVYDINKLAAEKYLQYYSNQTGKRAVTLRLSNIYGPGQKSKRPGRGIVNQMIKNALEGKPIVVYGDGSYIRDYLFIEDAVNAFVSASTYIEKTKGNYYSLGTGTGHTILQMASIIQEEVENSTKKKPIITFTPFPQGTSQIEYRNFIADSCRFKKDTSWSATISLREGIRKTITYYITKK